MIVATEEKPGAKAPPFVPDIQGPEGPCSLRKSETPTFSATCKATLKWLLQRRDWSPALSKRRLCGGTEIPPPFETTPVRRDWSAAPSKRRLFQHPPKVCLIKRAAWSRWY